ncbi:hypothetical protein [Maridesulfovibrio zosterae]|uniref:hypothetical protein n=1 Tax=Maridesulfovibrio zosterae TaxID=82171 RepID=UPI00041EEED1|nr:hypothetical protein [Maridesulfovibrio zosterae]
MKTVNKFLAALILFSLLPSVAYASTLASQAEHDQFRIFAIGWVKKLNRSHLKGFHNMEIILQEDGSYMARYHAINPDSIKCIVKNTSSKTKGMVGMLKYIETIYQSKAATPQEARSKKFTPVKNIRITEIFSNTGKGWR